MSQQQQDIPSGHNELVVPSFVAPVRYRGDAYSESTGGMQPSPILVPTVAHRLYPGLRNGLRAFPAVETVSSPVALANFSAQQRKLLAYDHTGLSSFYNDTGFTTTGNWPNMLFTGSSGISWSAPVPTTHIEGVGCLSQGFPALYGIRSRFSGASNKLISRETPRSMESFIVNLVAGDESALSTAFNYTMLFLVVLKLDNGGEMVVNAKLQRLSPAETVLQTSKVSLRYYIPALDPGESCKVFLSKSSIMRPHTLQVATSPDQFVDIKADGTFLFRGTVSSAFDPISASTPVRASIVTLGDEGNSEPFLLTGGGFDFSVSFTPPKGSFFFELTQTESVAFIPPFTSTSVIDIGDYIDAPKNFKAEPYKLVDVHTDSGFYYVHTELVDTTFITSSGIGGYFGGQSGLAIDYHGRFWAKVPSVYSRFRSEDEEVMTSFTEASADAPVSFGDLILTYSEQGYVNMFDLSNSLRIPTRSSKEIVALVSSANNPYGQAGGLLVFCDSDCWIVRGDPLLQNLSVELAPWPIGCDPGTTPTFSAGVIWVIWRGELYQLLAGDIKKVSNGQVLPDEKVVQAVVDVSPDYDLNVFVRIESTSLRTCWRYFPETDWWSSAESAFVRGSSFLGPIGLALPNPDGGPRFMDRGLPISVPEASTFDYMIVNPARFNPQDAGNISLWPGYPRLVYENIDFEDQFSVDKVHYVRVPCKNFPFFDYTMAVPKPRLYYNVVPSTEDHLEYESWVEPLQQYRDEIVFALPHRLRSRAWDLAIYLPGVGGSTVLETPLVITWSRGYRRKR